MCRYRKNIRRSFFRDLPQFIPLSIVVIYSRPAFLQVNNSRNVRISFCFFAKRAPVSPLIAQSAREIEKAKKTTTSTVQVFQKQ